MDWREGAGIWPASLPAQSVWIEVNRPGSPPLIFLFNSPPTLSQVIKKADFPSPSLAGGSLLNDGTRVLISFGPNGELGTDLKTFSSATSMALGRRIDINKAGFRDLTLLPGVGPVTARRILADRRARGPLTDLDDLVRIKGLGPESAARLRGLVTVKRPEPR
ncbi:MAG: helix-hairpin-helix domain-containing protein [Candidatus Adiutricales bacterium]